MIPRSKVAEVVRKALGKGYAVFAPAKDGALALLGPVSDPASVDLDHVLTVNTLKDIVLPRVEALADFNKEDQAVRPLGDDAGRILVFGNRPCDAAALEITDAILMGPMRDARYTAKRERMVVATVGCSKCDDACFCTSMGYGPHDPTGSDILFLPATDHFLVRSLTARGRRFLDDMDIQADGSGRPDEPPELKRKLDTGGLKAWLDENFESPRWHAVSENCVSCGTCLYLCPTCHCYDIVDSAGLSRGRRQRIWDCCSYSDFTRMASHQPRVGRHARYRQRTMHKFKYCPDSIGKVACVGCGRCIRFCPYGVDVCEVLESLVTEE